MPLGEAVGNMYDWVTHNWTTHRGECEFGCSYCYVKHSRGARYYTGKMHLVEKELRSSLLLKKWRETHDYRTPVIFVGHMIDLFAPNIPNEEIEKVVEHCREFPDNQYLFQTKNPERLLDFAFPEGSIFGTTLETDDYPHLWSANSKEDGSVESCEMIWSKAPRPEERARSFTRFVSARRLIDRESRFFVTIEPIMKFDKARLLNLLLPMRPGEPDFFINIGGDSKATGLIEPSRDELIDLIVSLRIVAPNIRIKTNLTRLFYNTPVERVVHHTKEEDEQLLREVEERIKTLLRERKVEVELRFEDADQEEESDA